MPQVKHIEPGPDCISLLLTTDNHVGYNEVDPIRGDDGWKTFDEVMKIAIERDVDMVIQGGDLFHTNKPSKKSMYYVMKTLRESCMGNKPFQLELLSDPVDAMCNKSFNYPNFEDPNINVSIPVFGISGNHDDATGDDLLAAMDLLAVCGLFNHFGKVNQNDIIHVSPLLFAKGSTKLALYGMASVRDERLYRTFRDGGVKFSRPLEEEWFHLMCVHQNRTQYSGTDYLPEVLLPNFLDFVLWGHEHECIPYASTNPEHEFHVLQPGSSLATSLSDSEYQKKHVFILNIKNNNFSLEPIPLKSVRPFETQNIVLSETGLSASKSDKNAVLNYLIDQVDRLIAKANQSWMDINDDSDPSAIPLPLIRLKVEYSGGYDVENPRRFSNRFVGKVANVNDVVIFYKRKASEGTILKSVATSKSADTNIDDSIVNELEADTNIDISELVNRALQDDDLILLQKKEMNKVIDSTITQEDKNILKTFVEKELDKDLKLLLSLNIGDNEDMTTVDNTSVLQLKKGFRNMVKELKTMTAYSDNKEGEKVGRGKKKPPVSSKLVVEADSDNDIDESNILQEFSKRSVRDKTPSKVDKMIIDSDEDYAPVQEIVSSDSGEEYREEVEETPKKKTTTGKAKKKEVIVSDEDELIDIPTPKKAKSKAVKIAKPKVPKAVKATPSRPSNPFANFAKK